MSKGSSLTSQELGRIAWRPSVAAVGLHPVEVTVTDAPGAATTASFQVAVSADTQAPKVSIVIDQNPAAIGALVGLRVLAADNVGVASMTLTVDGTPVAINAAGTASVAADVLGDHAVVATATDAAGNVVSAAETLQVVDPTDMEAPRLSIASPADRAVITAPTDIVGAVTDANLASYRLLYAPLGSDDFTEFAAGSQTGDVPAVLGRFDTTMIPNGPYVVRLEAQDANGHESAVERIVNVEGDLKLGNFTVSFTDLTVPVAGIPITITRTYDTLDANRVGDFGYGWRIGFKDVRLSVDEETLGLRGLQDRRAFVNGTRVQVVLPGGKTEGFTFRPVPGQDVLGITLSYQPAFLPDPGNSSILTVPKVAIVPLGSEWVTVDGVTYNPADPTTGGVYYLETIDGNKRTIDADTQEVISIQDRNENKLTFKEDGVESNRGRKVVFERDYLGRITKIIDPRGNSIVYEYDAAGNLVRILDRTQSADKTSGTELSYLSSPAHYLDEIHDATGSQALKVLYREDGRVDRILGANGYAASASYDLAKLTEAVTEPDGKTRQLTYDARGNTIEEIDEEGNVTLQVYDEYNRVVSATLVIGAVDSVLNGETDDLTSTFHYDSSGAMTSMTDSLGLTTRFTYTDSGLPVTISDPAGNTARFAYDTAGNLLARTNPAGATTYSQWDSHGNMAGYTVGATHAAFQHNEMGDLVGATDPRGVTTTIQRDANGNRLGTSYTWINPNDPSDQREVAITHLFDENDQLVETISPDGRWTTEYNVLGLPVRTTSPNTDNTMFYDARGEMVQVAFADGQVVQTVYDTKGRETWVTLPHLPQDATRATRYYYDGLDRIIAEEQYDNVLIAIRAQANGSYQSVFVSSDVAPLSRSETEYNEDGAVRRAQNAEGLVTLYEYDRAGRETATIQIVDGMTIRTESQYDDADNKIISRDALGRETRYEYDRAGRVAKTIYPDGTFTTTLYDDRGAITAATDQLGRTTQYSYDMMGNLTEVRLPEVSDPASGQPESPVYEYEYDRYNNLTVIRDPYGREERFEYDQNRNKVVTTLPEIPGEPTATEHRSYDDAGRVKTITDFKGQVTAHTYDRLRRIDLTEYFISQSAYEAGQPTDVVDYVYDVWDDLGRHEQVVDSRGVTDYLFDAEGRILSISSPEGVIHYEYDPASGRQTRMYTEFSDVQYAYDVRGLVTSVTTTMQLGTVLPTPEVTTYRYNEVGALVESSLPNGVTSIYVYDLVDRPRYIEYAAQDGTLLDSYYYVRDAAGKIVAVFNDLRQADVEAALAAGSADLLDRSVYEYDALDRLLSEAHFEELAATPFHSVDYEWDLVSNLLAKTTQREDGSVETNRFSYNERNQLVDEVFSIDDAEQWTKLFDYDANGSLVHEQRPGEVVDYVYNLRNRLAHAIIQRDEAGELVTLQNDYSYDHTGIKARESVTRTDSGGSTTATTLYINDPQSPYGYSRVVEERTEGGIIKASFVHGPAPISRTTPEGTLFYLSDAHSGVRHLVDPQGIITDSYFYEAFGKIISSQGATPNPLLYRGEAFDPNLGTYYLRARDYRPDRAAFLSADPIDGILSSPITFHDHLYGAGDPLQRLDPSGRSLMTGSLAGLGMQASMQAAKIGADLEQKKRIEEARLGQIATWMIWYNLYVVETEERTLAYLLPLATPYNIELASMAPMNAPRYFRESTGKIREFLRFAMNYGINRIMHETGLFFVKSNGLPNFTAIATHHFPGSITFWLLSGDHGIDVLRAKVNTNLWWLPEGLYHWHHHEVMGIMFLVPLFFHKAAHLGGRELWQVANGADYKNTPPWFL
jgi:RHS repeat-associated protein